MIFLQLHYANAEEIVWLWSNTKWHHHGVHQQVRNHQSFVAHNFCMDYTMFIRWEGHLCIVLHGFTDAVLHAKEVSTYQELQHWVTYISFCAANVPQRIIESKWNEWWWKYFNSWRRICMQDRGATSYMWYWYPWWCERNVPSYIYYSNQRHNDLFSWQVCKRSISILPEPNKADYYKWYKNVTLL